MTKGRTNSGRCTNLAKSVQRKTECELYDADDRERSDLFGHYDLNGNFIEGPICSAFGAAAEDLTKSVLLCLDEMNLARVEYYLSDFLSVIESREKSDAGKRNKKLP